MADVFRGVAMSMAKPGITCRPARHIDNGQVVKSSQPRSRKLRPAIGASNSKPELTSRLWGSRLPHLTSLQATLASRAFPSATPAVSAFLSHVGPKANFAKVSYGVIKTDDQGREIHISTELSGPLVVHWGIRKSQNNQDWVVPAENGREIPGSMRSLMQANEVGGSDAVIRVPTHLLTPYSILEFCLNKIDTDTWLHYEGNAFHCFSLPLPHGDAAPPVAAATAAPANPPDAAEKAANLLAEIEKAIAAKSEAAPVTPPVAPGGYQRPPQDLCERWSYLRWERAHRPTRKFNEQSKEFELAVAELEGLMRAGWTVEQLWNSQPSGWAKEGMVGTDMPVPYTEASVGQAVRRAGVLLHVTSLPSPFGIGELGDDAYRFVDWLAAAGMSIWQVLPMLLPGRPGPYRDTFWSPYSSQDACCGNAMLISIDHLIRDGLLKPSERPKELPAGNIDYDAVAAVKDPLLALAADRLLSGKDAPPTLVEEFAAFQADPDVASWVNDAALFAALDARNPELNWWQWAPSLRDRDPVTLETARSVLHTDIRRFVAQQFLFERQWGALKRYANSKGISVFGDMPIYVGAHSADVWVNRKLFVLDAATGAPAEVSGAPPDMFSATGQLWNQPLYNWPAHKADSYAWWARRLKRALHLYDELRIDHFRGLAGYWAIPAGAKDAMGGRWKVGPRKDFFDGISRHLGPSFLSKLIAEDLGVITPDVHELRREVGSPGMVVLQFAFDGASRNVHLPHNHEPNSVCYAGTHDNDTSRGWYESADEKTKDRVRVYLRCSGVNIAWDMIEAAFRTVSNSAIVTMQDVMGLDNSHRMNIPGQAKGQWGWRVWQPGFFSSQGAAEMAVKLRGLAERYERLL
eukprot:jgi/Mesvir1/9762/Mv12217-RA.1